MSVRPLCAVAILAVVATPAGASAQAEHREVIAPVPGAERVRVENLLGNVQVRTWDRPGEVHIVADKRGPSPDVVDHLRVHYRHAWNGEILIETTYETADGRERSGPLSGARVDLLIEMAPEIELSAKTFSGDLSASGLRAGARLETNGGRIGISDVHGDVVTRQMRGGQTVVAVRGDLDLDGVEGNMSLRQLSGGRVDARVVDGRIDAEDVRSDWVRLRSTTGEVVLVGALRPGARYELASYQGDVHIILPAGPLPPPFEVRSRAGKPVETTLPLAVVSHDRDLVRSVFAPAKRRRGTAATPPETALVELTSALGRVSIQPR